MIKGSSINDVRQFIKIFKTPPFNDNVTKPLIPKGREVSFGWPLIWINLAIWYQIYHVTSTSKVWRHLWMVLWKCSCKQYLNLVIGEWNQIFYLTNPFHPTKFLDKKFFKKHGYCVNMLGNLGTNVIFLVTIWLCQKIRTKNLRVLCW